MKTSHRSDRSDLHPDRRRQLDFNVRQLFHIIGIDEFGRAKENGGDEAVSHGQGNRLVPRTVSKVADAHLNGAAKCAADAR